MVGARACAVRRVVVAVVVAAPALAACGPPSPAVTVTEIESLGGEFTQPYDIDEDGRVVGATQSTDAGASWPAEGQPFVWEDGTTTALVGTPYGGRAVAVDGDRVLGAMWGEAGEREPGSAPYLWSGDDLADLTPLAPDEGLVYHPRALAGDAVLLDADRWLVYQAVLWQDGVATPTASLPGAGGYMRGADVNSAGVVVGPSARYPDQPSLWSTATGLVDVGTLGGAHGDTHAVNEAGQVAGDADTTETTETGTVRRAFLWEDGELTDLGSLGAGWSRVSGRALSEAGHVIGLSGTAAGEEHAFLWSPGGPMRDLGTLGGTTSHAVAVNVHGQVVGTSTTATGERHAFVWSDGRMTDLTALAPGVTVVVDVNDAGQVIGYDPVGGRAVVWDVPVPS